MMKITWETRGAGTTWSKSLPCIVTPATSDGEVCGFLSKHVFFQSRVVSYEAEVGCWDPQVDPGLPVPRHTPTVLNTTRHFLEARILEDTKIDLTLAFFIMQIINRSISFQGSRRCHCFWKW